MVWQRILSLEMQRERSSQQLLEREQEISGLRQQLRAAHGDVVSSLQSQLEQKQQEAQQRERQFQALSEETEDLKNKYCAVSERCDTLEKQKVGESTLDPSDAFMWIPLRFLYKCSVKHVKLKMWNNLSLE